MTVRSERRWGLSLATIAAIVAYVALSLLPLLSSGYYSDDLISSTLRGQLQLRGVSFVESVIAQNRAWVVLNGRLFPVHLLTLNAISYVSYDLPVYKALLLSLNVINVLLFGYLLFLHTGHRSTSCLGMLLLPTLFQFRLYHDPILSFFGMMQIFVAFLLAAMIFLYKYLEHERRTYLLLSLLLYNLCLYYYEVSIPLLLVFVTIVMWKRPSLKDRLALSSPYSLSVAVALAAMLTVRTLRDVASAPYPGIVFNFQMKPIVKTFALQLYASLPLTYYTGNPSHLFRHDVRSFVANVAWSDLSVLILLVSLYLALRSRPLAVQGIPMLFVLGSMLMICPSLLVSMSLKYQGDLGDLSARGMGYIPVYVEYYGTALLITGCLLLALQTLRSERMSRVGDAALLLVMGMVVLVNVQSNRMVVEKANVDLHYRRTALTRALADHILADVPDGAQLYILDEYTFDPYPWVAGVKRWATTYPWKSEALVYLYARKRVHIVGDLDLRAYALSPKAGHDGLHDTYLLNIKSYPDDVRVKDGYVVLSKIRDVYLDQADKIHLEAIPIRSDFPSGSPPRK